MNSKLGGYFTDAKVPLHQAGFLKDFKQNVLLQLVVYFIIHRAVSGLLLILSLCGYSQKYQEMYYGKLVKIHTWHQICLESELCYLLDVQSWANCLVSLTLLLSSVKLCVVVGMVIVSTLQCCKNQMK